MWASARLLPGAERRDLLECGPATAGDRGQRLEIAAGSKLGLPARQRRTAGDLAAFARLGLSKALPDLQLRLAPSKKTGVRLAEVVARVRLART